MKHHASPSFWEACDALPEPLRRKADAAFALLKADRGHPSLHFKKVGPYWSARVDLKHRALAVSIPDGYLWFWIGDHARYDQLVSGRR